MDCTLEYEEASNTHQMVIDYSWILMDDTMVCCGDGIYFAGYILESIINEEPLPEGPISGIIDSFHLIDGENGFIKIHKQVFDTFQVSYHRLNQLDSCFILDANTILPVNHRQILAEHYRRCLSVRLQAELQVYENSKELFNHLMGSSFMGKPALLNAVSYTPSEAHRFHVRIALPDRGSIHRSMTLHEVSCPSSISSKMLWNPRVFMDNVGPMIKISSQMIPIKLYNCKIYQVMDEKVIVSHQNEKWIFFFAVHPDAIIYD